MDYVLKTGNRFLLIKYDATDILYMFGHRLRPFLFAYALQSKSFRLEPPKVLSFLQHRAERISTCID